MYGAVDDQTGEDVHDLILNTAPLYNLAGDEVHIPVCIREDGDVPRILRHLTPLVARRTLSGGLIVHRRTQR